MMFVYPILIQKNTPKSAPLLTQMQLARGKITNMQVQFPSGVVALAHIQLSVGLHQLYPTNPEQDFATSNETIYWDEDYDLDSGDFIMRAVAWNTDLSNDHTITVRVVIREHLITTDLAGEIAALLAPQAGPPLPPSS